MKYIQALKQLRKGNTFAKISLAVSAVSAILMLIPFFGSISKFMAIIALVFGVIAWVKKEHRWLSGGAIILAIFVFVIRYLLVTLLFVALLAVAFFYWRNKK